MTNQNQWYLDETFLKSGGKALQVHSVFVSFSLKSGVDHCGMVTNSNDFPLGCPIICTDINSQCCFVH